MFAFDAYIESIHTRLEHSLPGFEAHKQMEPAYRRQPLPPKSSDPSSRDAAVLAVLYPSENDPTLIFTVRRHDLKNHAGQISFPGGRNEPDETLEETALRETQEEINLNASSVQILGQLTPLLIRRSGYRVYPFVGAVYSQPFLSAQDDEVARIIHIPVKNLQHPETVMREKWTLHGRDVMVPFYSVESHKIWGATAMMLAELLMLVP